MAYLGENSTQNPSTIYTAGTYDRYTELVLGAEEPCTLPLKIIKSSNYLHEPFQKAEDEDASARTFDT